MTADFIEKLCYSLATDSSETDEECVPPSTIAWNDECLKAVAATLNIVRRLYFLVLLQLRSCRADANSIDRLLVR